MTTTTANAEALQNAIANCKNKALTEEIQLLVDNGETLLDAFLTLDDLSDTEQSLVRYRTACRKVLIDAGFYRPMSQEEIDSTTTSRGYPWDFKMKGIAYRGSESMQGWLEK